MDELVIVDETSAEDPTPDDDPSTDKPDPSDDIVDQELADSG